MEIDQILSRVYPLPETSGLRLKACAVEAAYPKGHLLFRADKVEASIYFIRQGIVRAYSSTGGNEVTFWFGKEGDTVVSMKSYVAHQKGYEDVELLEDCVLYELKAESLQRLFDEDIHVANWGRKFAEKELVKAEERLISRQFRTATDRYKNLLKAQPGLVQRVQLGHIASYLGITQVSLSRIRGEIK
jgi:CRP-like cAMP-binding protein